MPGFDQTGPMGQGPMTGRGMGRCAGAAPGYGFGFGRGRGFGCFPRGMGYGRGFGFGRGFGRGFGFAGTAQVSEKDALTAEIERLDQEKKLLKQRLSEIEEQPGS